MEITDASSKSRMRGLVIAKTKGVKQNVQCWRLTWSAVRVARFAVGAQAAQVFLILAVGALPAGLLARETLIRRHTASARTRMRHL
jgi:hypothetical protein